MCRWTRRLRAAPCLFGPWPWVFWKGEFGPRDGPVAVRGRETRELAILPSRPRHRQTGWLLLGTLTGCLVPHAAGGKHLGRIPPPPISRRQDLDLVETPVPRLLHPRTYERKIDHAITHHSPVGEQVGGGHQPVADVERKQALVACAFDLSLERGVPPDVVGVHYDTEGSAPTAVQLVAELERLREGVHAGPDGAVHRGAALPRAA